MLLVEMFKETVTLNFVIEKKKTVIHISVYNRYVIHSHPHICVLKRRKQSSTYLCITDMFCTVRYCTSVNKYEAHNICIDYSVLYLLLAKNKHC